MSNRISNKCKLQQPCQTRWTEKHSAVLDLYLWYLTEEIIPFLLSLMLMCNNRGEGWHCSATLSRLILGSTDSVIKKGKGKQNFSCIVKPDY